MSDGLEPAALPEGLGIPAAEWQQTPQSVRLVVLAQFISICRWLQLIHKDRLAPLENAPFSTLWARKRYRVA